MWAAIVGAVVAVGSSVASFFISDKGQQKQDILQIMEEYVVGYGYSFDAVSDLFPDLYRKNKEYFEQQYNIAWARHEAQPKGMMETMKSNAQPVMIVVVIALFVYFLTTEI